jgi:GT2 family glycosyltransferase
MIIKHFVWSSLSLKPRQKFLKFGPQPLFQVRADKIQVNFNGEKRPETIIKTSDFKSLNSSVLILTPMKNSIRHVDKYFELLTQIDYPQDKISLGILVSDSYDLTFEYLAAYIDLKLANRKYAGVTLIKHDQGFHLDSAKRHEYDYQPIRRSFMAKGRNILMVSTLELQHDYVLWLDSDLVYYPPSLLRDLISTGKDIVVPNCVAKNKHEVGIYDRNNWIETEYSLKLQQHMDQNEVTFEGYDGQLHTGRVYLGDLYRAGENDIETVELDGVGATCLLVKASIHREGVMFPSMPFKNTLETEGFCQQAKFSGYKCHGLPHYLIYHS